VFAEAPCIQRFPPIRIQRQNRFSGRPLGCRPVLKLASFKAAERPEQEVAKPSAQWVSLRDRFLFENPDEKCLQDILGIMMRAPLSPQKRVQRIPVRNYLKSRLAAAEPVGAAVPQQRAGQLNEAQIVEPVFVVADENRSAFR